jgi:hypothetical protein
MSELLQSGHHPDADQLNAFVEHTLPRHEQEQTLAHLAICPDCRSIVSLSLPPVDEVPGLHREPVRKSWFLSGSFVWPVAAALAGVVLFIVHFHNVAIQKGINAAPTELAASPPPAPLPNAASSTPTTPRAQPPLTSEQQIHDRRAKATVGTSKTADHAQAEAFVENQSIAVLPLETRNRAELKTPQPKPPIEPANKPMRSLNGPIAGNLVTNGGAVLHQAPANAKDLLQQNASGAGLGNVRDQSAKATPAAAPATSFRQGETGVAPAPPASSQTVEVTGSAASVATVSSMSNSLILNQANGILIQRLLPSGLAALSLVSAGRQILAIDTHNTLFFSDDNGMHWKAVPSQWQGKAVKVDVASAADVSGGRSTLDAKSTHSASKVTAIGGPIPSPSAKSTLTGTVTDATGAVIADAAVIISNATTPDVRTVKTGRDGHYLVDDLVPGSYQVEAQAPGFNAQQLAVTLAPSGLSMANIALSVGQAAQNVTVDAAAISLETPSLAKKKTSEPSLTGIQPPLLFEITTDTGERWTSSDGQAWKRK